MTPCRSLALLLAPAACLRQVPAAADSGRANGGPPAGITSPVTVRIRGNPCEGTSHGKGAEDYHRLEAAEFLPPRPGGDRREGDEPMLLDRNDGGPDISVQVEYETAPPGGNEGAATRILVGTALQEKVTRTGVLGMTTVRAGNSGIAYDSKHGLPISGTDVPDAAGTDAQFLHVYGRESRPNAALPADDDTWAGVYRVWGTGGTKWPTYRKQVTSEWMSACRGSGPTKVRRFAQTFTLQNGRTTSCATLDATDPDIAEILDYCLLNRLNPHEGFDVSAQLTEQVVSAADGIITRRHTDTVNNGRDSIVVVKHVDGSGLWYLHTNPVPGLGEGDSVRAGDQIGTSGYVAQPHTHVEYMPEVNGRTDLPQKNDIRHDPWDEYLDEASFDDADLNLIFACVATHAFRQAFPPISPEFPVCGMMYPRRGPGTTLEDALRDADEPRYGTPTTVSGITFPVGWPSCPDPRN